MDADDAHHASSLELLQTYPGPILVPMLVVTEVTYLLATRLGVRAEALFLGDLASGALTAVAVEPADWMRIAELVIRCADLPLGTADASVVVAAERLGASTIATFDRRHFTVVRARHLEAFTLLP